MQLLEVAKAGIFESTQVNNKISYFLQLLEVAKAEVLDVCVVVNAMAGSLSSKS